MIYIYIYILSQLTNQDNFIIWKENPALAMATFELGQILRIMRNLNFILGQNFPDISVPENYIKYTFKKYNCV